MAARYPWGVFCETLEMSPFDIASYRDHHRGVLGRILIADVRPSTPLGYPAKVIAGDATDVTVDLVADGHDYLAGRVRWKAEPAGEWLDAPLHELNNDRYQALITCPDVGPHTMFVEAWRDHWGTWHHGIKAKLEAGQEVLIELEDGARLLEERADQAGTATGLDEVNPCADKALRGAAAVLRDVERSAEERVAVVYNDEINDLMTAPLRASELTTSAAYPLWADRERAEFSSWYEFFPRSEGGLVGAMRRLSDVAAMGFDVVYFPPIHPIGHSFRKGPNNTLTAGSNDPGSPWAIGSRQGGHTDIHPELGTLTDFELLVERAQELGLEIALDYALQCSPDHPWAKEHPEWFHVRSDGSIAYAENPPKKYQDIYPINFWPAKESDRQALWAVCRDVLEYWIGKGVKIFRVDNPHTKPLAFWEWCLADIQSRHPEVLFLAEAFTMPKMMAGLAEVGFTMSYTYFTWRNTADELGEYFLEVNQARTADYMRPNFWPNTPDILSGPLRNGPPAAFKMRLLLAATMSPNYGVYSGFELCENEPYSDENEEYFHSEKYELKRREWTRPDSLAGFMGNLNQIRRLHPALQRLGGAALHACDNPELLCYSKTRGDDRVVMVVNLDPLHTQSGWLQLDREAVGLSSNVAVQAHDELSGETYMWDSSSPWVRLDPDYQPGHILTLHPLG